MLFKKRDEWAQALSEYDVIKALPDSVTTKPLGLVEEREPKVARPAPDTLPSIDVSAAVSAPLPAKLEPQRATLTSSLPTTGDWIIESKLDGYRMLARVDKGRVRLFTSGGHDWTKKLATLATEVAKLPLSSGWLDGEIVVLRDGLPDFGALQTAIDGAANDEIVYFLFDLPYCDGNDLTGVPLWARRARLAQLLEKDSDRIRFSQDFDAPIVQMFEAAAGLGLEGLMLKRRDARYESGRTETWLKAKCRLRQELVICGFTARGGKEGEVGSLLLGYYVGKKLHDAGSVGTGWNARTGRDLWQRLLPLERDTSPFDVVVSKPGRWSRRAAGAERWVHPKLVAEIEFAEWTDEGVVRQASFKGLRVDKSAHRVVRETGEALKPAPLSQVKVTHPERVVDPTSGVSKLELVRYYESVAEWMLPHLVDRPIALVRAPAGIAGQTFSRSTRKRPQCPE
nr:non-homologous end-joining DNA ligase [Paraburkholderia kirstenboschensis]